MIVPILLVFSILAFVSGVATRFFYKSKRRTVLLVWAITATFLGIYLLIGALVLQFYPSILIAMPVLGIVIMVLDALVLRRVLGAVPTLEVEQTPISVNLGESYIFKGETPDKAFDLLKQLSQEKPCLCITSTHPEQVKRRYGLEKVKIVWLSKQEVEDAISPADLDILRDSIVDFAKRTNGSTILLDGVEYLAAMNSFENVMRFIHDVNGNIAHHDAILIIPLNPKALEERQLAILEKGMKVEK